MKKVITRVEFEWDEKLGEYVATNSTYYMSNETFSLCDSGDDSSSGSGVDSQNSFDDGSMANSMGQNSVTGGWNGPDSPGVETTTYDEVTGDIGTSGRGGNVGGISGPSGGVGVGGFGGKGAADDAVSSYESDPDGWNSTNNNYAGLDGPINGDTFANWMSRNGFLSQVGAGQKGALDDARSFANEHPGMMSVLGLGLSLVNPLAGGLYNAAYGLSQGKGGALGSLVGGISGIPGGAVYGGMLGNAVTGNWQGALASGIGYGLNSTGNGLGGFFSDAFGGKGTAGGVFGGSLGNAVQSAGIGAAVSSLGSAFSNGPSSNTASGGGLSSNTGGSGQGSGSSDSFSLSQGIGNNGGTGSFNLSGGLAGLGAGALGSYLYNNNGGSNMASNSDTDWLGSLFNMGTAIYGANDKSYSNNVGNLANTVSAMGDPFAPQRAQYQTALAESYNNPQAVYEKQYAPMDKAFYGDMMANDSASGRTTDAYKHGLAREAQFGNYLTNYRSQLAQLAGGNASPGAAAKAYAELQSKALDYNNKNSLNAIYAAANGLGKTGTGTGTGSGLSGLFGKAANGLGGLFGSASDYLSNLFSGYSSDGSLWNQGYTGAGTSIEDLINAGGYNGSGGEDYWSNYIPNPDTYDTDFNEWDM